MRERGVIYSFPMSATKNPLSAPPTYHVDVSYEENYRKGPFFSGPLPERKNTSPQNFMGFKVNSRFGVPAGPLLNSNWIALYAKLGYDLLVYKTVRSRFYPAHPPPNCLYLNLFGQLDDKDFGQTLVAMDPLEKRDDSLPVSITNSFGMPSREPAEWQADVRKAKASLSPGQLLIVSVVGTPGTGTSLEEDYANGALLAKEAGADIVEINLSCPNVTTGEGSLFTDPVHSAKVSKKVHDALRGTPLILKLGYIPDAGLLESVILANAPHAEGISSINTLSFKVVGEGGVQALPGPGRLQSGVCGAAIKSCGLKQAARTLDIRRRHRLDFSVIGVGGIMSASDLLEYENIGVDAAMSATGAMWDPYLAYKYYLTTLSKTGNTD